MIFGDPSKLAIQIELVPEWCSTHFYEGIFCIYLNRQRLSTSQIYVDTLTIATRQLINALQNILKDDFKPIKLPNSIMGMSNKEIFYKLYNITYPCDATDLTIDNCWNYVISPDAMTDRGFHLFIYEKDSVEVLLGGSIDTQLVFSTSLPIGTTLIIAKKANLYAENLVF
jgi:hypothetical protein